MPLSKGIGATQQGAAHVLGIRRLARRRQGRTLNLKQTAQGPHPSRKEVCKGDVDAFGKGGGGEGRVAPQGDGQAPRARR